MGSVASAIPIAILGTLYVYFTYRNNNYPSEKTEIKTTSVNTDPRKSGTLCLAFFFDASHT